MKMVCPQCSYEGEFQNAKVPFFAFSLLDSHIGRYRAKKTFVCPQCGCEIKMANVRIEEPVSRVVLYIVVGILIIATIIVLSELNR
ncbi:MAG: hypothetical protein HN904_19120 [Victivallales bacterium]|jgi:hypothetical protein|nr:hypothetical protein [Victivallales bacterium]